MGGSLGGGGLTSNSGLPYFQDIETSSQSRHMYNNGETRQLGRPRSPANRFRNLTPQFLLYTRPKKFLKSELFKKYLNHPTTQALFIDIIVMLYVSVISVHQIWNGIVPHE